MPASVVEQTERPMAEMLRLGERLIEQQIAAVNALDEKARQALTLGITAFGAPLVISNFGATPSLPVLAAGLGLNLIASVFFIDAYIGLRRGKSLVVGPSPAWIAEKAREAGFTQEEYYATILPSFDVYSRQNVEVVARQSGRLRRGLVFLLLAAAAYGASVLIPLAS